MQVPSGQPSVLPGMRVPFPSITDVADQITAL